MRLNLGCGNAPLPNSVNHDRTLHSEFVDIAWDLSRLPWPWEDEEFDAIVAKAVLEHLNHNLLISVNECWRILEPGGTLYMKLPAWNCEVSYQDPTHQWFYSPRVFEYFDPNTNLGRKYWFYTDRKWKLRSPGIYNSGHTSIHGTLVKVIEDGCFRK
jgi:SAM-dependent methyltransferase